MTKPIFDQNLQSLDARSRDIFRAIVDSYLRDGEPLGSRNLSRMLPASLSPATVRNVMSDLEQLGLIYAPHISAGRLPTQKGLRFFVDAFMELGDLSEDERRVIEAQVKATGSGATLEQMLTEASQMLSGMSRGAASSSRPRTRCRSSISNSSSSSRPARWPCWCRRTATSRTASSSCRKA